MQWAAGGDGLGRTGSVPAMAADRARLIAGGGGHPLRKSMSMGDGGSQRQWK